MRQLQNDLEKIGSFYQNHRSNIPPDSAFTYGLINKHRKYPFAAWLPDLLGRAERSSPKAAPRRAEGAGLDGQGAVRAIVCPPQKRTPTPSYSSARNASSLNPASFDDFLHQPARQLRRVHRHHGRAPRLRVPQRDVTSLLPLNFEPGVFENCDNLFRAQTRQSREHIKR